MFGSLRRRRNVIVDDFWLLIFGERTQTSNGGRLAGTATGPPAPGGSSHPTDHNCLGSKASVKGSGSSFNAKLVAVTSSVPRDVGADRRFDR